MENEWYIDKNGDLQHDDIIKSSVTLLQVYNYIKETESKKK